jgi:tetratricopeptide (TPR) repeat protein
MHSAYAIQNQSWTARLMLALMSALITFSLSAPTWAEHPHHVRKLEAEENFYDAYLAFVRIPPRSQTVESLISGARSAWALSLPDNALAAFKQALKRDVTAEQEGEILLSLSVIYFQERNFIDAGKYAKEVLTAFPQAHPYRGRANYILGEIAYEEQRLEDSAEFLEAAFKESSPDLLPRIAFLQGNVLLSLKRVEDARLAFEKVPVEHELARQAVRNLAMLALETADFEQAEFWLLRGKEQHPSLFVDSWVDLALLKIAISRKDEEQIDQIVRDAAKHYPPSDPWFTLLDAVAQEFLYRSTLLDMQDGKSARNKEAL